MYGNGIGGFEFLVVVLIIFVFSNALPALGVFFVIRRVKLDTWAMIVLPLITLIVPLGLTISLFIIAFLPTSKQASPIESSAIPVPPADSVI